MTSLEPVRAFQRHEIFADEIKSQGVTSTFQLAGDSGKRFRHPWPRRACARTIQRLFSLDLTLIENRRLTSHVGGLSFTKSRTNRIGLANQRILISAISANDLLIAAANSHNERTSAALRWDVDDIARIGFANANGQPVIGIFKSAVLVRLAQYVNAL